jgi:phosphoribosyl 1,2-cyclic phosphodiesterase
VTVRGEAAQLVEYRIPRPLGTTAAESYNSFVRVTVLGSGSGGNCCVVESGGTRVLVDAGLSAKEIERRMTRRGMSADTIAAIFLSHEHMDHSSGALVFSARWDAPVYATDGTAAAIGLEGDLFSPFVRIVSGREGRVGDLAFRALATPHDAAESVAYAFEDGAGRLVIASDLGRAEDVFVDFLRGATTVMLEMNHDEDMLRDGPYTWPLKRRISGGWGHLSNIQSAEAIRRSAGSERRRVVATHLSRTNNTPELVRAVLEAAIEKSGWLVPYAVADPLGELEAFDA